MYEVFADHGERVFVTVQEQGEAVNRWGAEASAKDATCGNSLCAIAQARAACNSLLPYGWPRAEPSWKHMIRIALSATLLLAASPSWGCSEPYASLSLPSAPGSYSKPDVPYCLSNYSFSGTHTCEEWEIDRYKREVEDYVEKLQDYINDAADVARKAAQFAEEAAEYARCEAEEVSNQHK